MRSFYQRITDDKLCKPPLKILSQFDRNSDYSWMKECYSGRVTTLHIVAKWCVNSKQLSKSSSGYNAFIKRRLVVCYSVDWETFSFEHLLLTVFACCSLCFVFATIPYEKSCKVLAKPHSTDYGNGIMV